MKHKKYNRGIIRKTAQGCYLAEVNYHYKRHRKTLKTLPQARTWIDATVYELDNQHRPLSPFELREAREAIARLPENVSLLEVVNQYLAQLHSLHTVSVQTAIEQYIDEKRQSGLRPRSLTELRVHLGRLQAQYGSLDISDITGANLISLFGLMDISATTRNNYRRTLRGFFTWCKKAGYMAHNPAEAITRARIDQKLPGILTVDQTRKILRSSVNTHLTAYFALALFAGIRPAEILRLKWQAISKHIHIGPSVAKTRAQRYVTITPNLKAWLREFGRRRGPVVSLSEKRFWKEFRAARSNAGITTWHTDAARHSFATYHLALHRDAPLTAHELGHTSPATLYKHYRNLATLNQAKKYFSITP